MTRDKLIELIEDTGRQPVSYSGRGMFGEKCVAVELDQYDSGHDLPDEDHRIDFLGLGKIIYWPWAKAMNEI
jgi:hypothetical protein